MRFKICGYFIHTAYGSGGRVYVHCEFTTKPTNAQRPHDAVTCVGGVFVWDQPRPRPKERGPSPQKIWDPMAIRFDRDRPNTVR